MENYLPENGIGQVGFIRLQFIEVFLFIEIEKGCRSCCVEGMDGGLAKQRNIYPKGCP